MKERKKILFLYFELAGYFTACLEYLVDKHEVDAHVIKYPVNAVAPFSFDLKNEHITYYEYNSFDQHSILLFCQELSPDLIICNGWSDSLYVQLCKKVKKEFKIILTFDNPWRNTIKQNLARIASRILLRPHFPNLWVPGKAQHLYAKKLGYADNQIKTGLYCCDHSLFNSYYLNYAEQKQKSFPKRFLFIGRYTKLKGVLELWNAFVQLQQEDPNEWELWCIGKGDLEHCMPDHPKIKNIGFVQPADLGQFIKECGVFILPSQYEHWGVVLHEMSLAGLPVICSDTTSAADSFVEVDVNGYIHSACDQKSIKSQLKKIISKSDEDLLQMANHSHRIGHTINFDTWSNSLLDYIKN